MVALHWPPRLGSSARVCWWLAGVAATILAIARVAYLVSIGDPVMVTVVEAAGNYAAVVAGLAAWVRRPDSRVGVLLVAWGWLGLVMGVGAHTRGPLLAWAYVSISLYWPVLAHLLLTYPTGRTQTAGERRFLRFAYATTLLWVTSMAVAELQAGGPCPSGQCPLDLGQIHASSRLGTTLWQMQKVVSITLATWFVVLVVRRWRRMSPAERRTAAPVVWATSGPLASFLLFATIDSTGVHNAAVWQTYFWLNRITNFWVPLALLIGLLATRLARADVTALLVRLRTASVDELRPALARLLRDPLMQIALPTPDAAGYVDPAGRPLDIATDDRRAITPIGHGALLLHHPSAHTEDPQLFDAAVAAMAMTLDNARLTAQVRAQLAEVSASRARLVAAADQQRRRIERDLHDGAQQQLLGLGMSLQAARTMVPDDSPAARFLDEATAQLHDSLAELRALSRGLRPALLAERGLEVALREVQRRANTPVDLTIELTGRPDPVVETAAYFVVTEALQNTVRHASHANVSVDIRQSGDTIDITICDDGPGGADQRTGSGLRGLTDRVAAAGGTLDVTSPPGRGTILAARLPMSTGQGPQPGNTGVR